jgi:two-component system CheB/CheR fusion protein
MPADCGMAFVMILHLPADRKSMLADILGRWTPMQVLEGLDGEVIRPNCVYVPPPHAIVTVEDGRLRVQMPAPEDHRIPRPIDAFFDSLGLAIGDQAVGIVFSGTGSDGALGLKAIKECGGLTIAQGSDGTAPLYGEMPAGAIATGAVDVVASIEDIPGHLVRIKGSTLEILDPPEDSRSRSMRLGSRFVRCYERRLGMISADIVIRPSYGVCSGACKSWERSLSKAIYPVCNQTITRFSTCFGIY